jgi:hypothetical protein
MQAIQALTRKERYGQRSSRIGLLKGGVQGLTRLFGCWHQNMSRPFTRGRETYRVCLGCGARRRFDLERWEMNGAYYFNAAAKG